MITRMNTLEKEIRVLKRDTKLLRKKILPNLAKILVMLEAGADAREIIKIFTSTCRYISHMSWSTDMAKDHHKTIPWNLIEHVSANIYPEGVMISLIEEMAKNKEFILLTGSLEVCEQYSVQKLESHYSELTRLRILLNKPNQIQDAIEAIQYVNDAIKENVLALSKNKKYDKSTIESIFKVIFETIDQIKLTHTDLTEQRIILLAYLKEVTENLKSLSSAPEEDTYLQECINNLNLYIKQLSDANESELEPVIMAHTKELNSLKDRLINHNLHHDQILQLEKEENALTSLSEAFIEIRHLLNSRRPKQDNARVIDTKIINTLSYIATNHKILSRSLDLKPILKSLAHLFAKFHQNGLIDQFISDEDTANLLPKALARYFDRMNEELANGQWGIVANTSPLFEQFRILPAKRLSKLRASFDEIHTLLEIDSSSLTISDLTLIHNLIAAKLPLIEITLADIAAHNPALYMLLNEAYEAILSFQHTIQSLNVDAHEKLPNTIEESIASTHKAIFTGINHIDGLKITKNRAKGKGKGKEKEKTPSSVNILSSCNRALFYLESNQAKLHQDDVLKEMKSYLANLNSLVIPDNAEPRETSTLRSTIQLYNKILTLLTAENVKHFSFYVEFKKIWDEITKESAIAKDVRADISVIWNELSSGKDKAIIQKYTVEQLIKYALDPKKLKQDNTPPINKALKHLRLHYAVLQKTKPKHPLLSVPCQQFLAETANDDAYNALLIPITPPAPHTEFNTLTVHEFLTQKFRLSPTTTKSLKKVMLLLKDTNLKDFLSLQPCSSFIRANKNVSEGIHKLFADYKIELEKFSSSAKHTVKFGDMLNDKVIFSLLSSTLDALIDVKSKLSTFQRADQGSFSCIASLLTEPYENELLTHCIKIISSVLKDVHDNGATPQTRLAALRCIAVLGETYKVLNSNTKNLIACDVDAIERLRDKIYHRGSQKISGRKEVDHFITHGTKHPDKKGKAKQKGDSSHKGSSKTPSPMPALEMIIEDLIHFRTLCQTSSSAEIMQLQKEAAIARVGDLMGKIEGNDIFLSVFSEIHINNNIPCQLNALSDKVDLTGVIELIAQVRIYRGRLAHKHLTLVSDLLDSKQKELLAYAMVHDAYSPSRTTNPDLFLSETFLPTMQLCWIVLKLTNEKAEVRENLPEYIKNDIAKFEHILGIFDPSIDMNDRLETVRQVIKNLIKHFGKPALEVALGNQLNSMDHNSEKEKKGEPKIKDPYRKFKLFYQGMCRIQQQRWEQPTQEIDLNKYIK